MNQKILKDYNKELNSLVLFNLLLFIIMGYGIGFVTDHTNLIKLILILVIPLLPSLLITNFIPVKYKNVFILNSKYEKEPILSLLKREDNSNKIDFKLIKLVYGNYSEDYNEQKILWYKIYRKHEYDPRISQINRQYLMTRDFVVITIISTIFLLLFVVFVGNIKQDVIWWFILMFLEIILFQYMANNFYNSLSKSVLLEETYHLRNKYSTNDKYCFTYV